MNAFGKTSGRQGSTRLAITKGLLCAFAAAALALPLAGHAVEPIVIGQSLPTNGGFDVISAHTLSGAKSYVEAGGVRGRPLQLITLDDAGDPKRHGENMRKLVQEHNAVALMNCLGDASCAAAAEVARQLRVPLIGPVSGVQTLSRASNPFVFRIRPPYVREADALAKQLLALGTLNVAIVTDVHPRSETVSAFVDALTRLKINSSVTAIDAANDGSFKNLMAELGATRYQAVFFDIHTAATDQLVQLGLDKSDRWPLLVTTLASGNVSTLLNSFSSRMLGFTSVVPNPELAAIPLARELQQHAERFGGTLGSAVTYAGMESYINARVCVEAIRRAEGSKVDARSVLGALNSFGKLDLGGFTLNFSQNEPSASGWVDIVVRSRTGYLLK